MGTKKSKPTPKKPAVSENPEDKPRISVVFTEEERHAVRMAAASYDLSMSAFIKTTLGEAGVFDDIESEYRVD